MKYKRCMGYEKGNTQVMKSLCIIIIMHNKTVKLILMLQFKSVQNALLIITIIMFLYSITIEQFITREEKFAQIR